MRQVTVSFQEQEQEGEGEGERGATGGVGGEKKKVKAGQSVTMFYIRCISWREKCGCKEQKRGDTREREGEREREVGRRSGVSSSLTRTAFTFTIRRHDNRRSFPRDH